MPQQGQQQGQAPQTSANQQVPDYRRDELAERIRQLELQNTQLRTSLDHVTRQQQPNSQQQSEPIFKPEVEQGMRQLFESWVKPIRTEFANQLGYLVDQTDEAKYMLQYGNSDKFNRFNDKVDRLRQDYQARGQYIPREEALRIVYLEETGKKAQPDPQAPPPQPQEEAPKFDPYFKAYVDPKTGKPITGIPGEMGEPQQQMQPQFQQQPQQQMQPQYPQSPQEQYQQNQQIPYQQQMQQAHVPTQSWSNGFDLGDQNPNPASPSAAPQPHRYPQIDLTSTDADLQAFEDRFGDIPL
jgi:hypothetical protein